MLMQPLLSRLAALASIPGGAGAASRPLVSLSSAHAAGGAHCPHQGPIVAPFAAAHKEVKVIRAQCRRRRRRFAIEGTSGHPVMVLPTDNGKRQPVGEISLPGLERECVIFKEQCLGEHVIEKASRGGSHLVCH